MRDLPSCVVTLRRFGVWCGAVAVVTTAAVATSAAWAWAMWHGRSDHPAAMLAVAGVLIVATAWIAYSLARVEPGVLALHDGCWTYTTRRVSGEASDSGPLAVALDLGSFLLLTMTRAGARGPQARRWIPVQRHGLDGDWHALRCAVYSPPPAAPRVSASDGSGTE